jgi:signal peptidase
VSHSLTPQESAALAKAAAAEQRREKKAAAAEAARKATLGQTIRTGLSLGIFAIVLGLVAVIIIIPKILGATPLTILTSSMEPGLPPGTLVVVAPVKPEEVRIGDVITYQIESGRPEVVTHRVTEVTASTSGDTTFILQGDNNDEPDPPVMAIQLQGKLVYSLPWVGHLSSVLNGPSRATVLPIIAAAMLAYAVISIALGLIGVAKKRKGTPRHAAVAAAGAADTNASRDGAGPRDGSVPRDGELTQDGDSDDPIRSQFPY